MSDVETVAIIAGILRGFSRVSSTIASAAKLSNPAATGKAAEELASEAWDLLHAARWGETDAATRHARGFGQRQ